jgi:hypothetical protein
MGRFQISGWLSCAGFGLGLLVAILDWQNIDAPEELVVCLIVLAGLLFAGGIVLAICSLVVSMLRRDGMGRLLPSRRKEPIEVFYVPDPGSAFIHLYVRNNRATDHFVAQVSGICGAQQSQKVPWEVKWRGQTTEPKRRIIGGTDWPLDLCQAFPPRPHDKVLGAVVPGGFVFYSTSLPSGWEIKPGPTHVVVPYGTEEEMETVVSQRGYYSDELTLKLVVEADSSGKTTTKRVCLAFNTPFASDDTEENVRIFRRVTDLVRVDINDWRD